jgi:hypothetical protein
VLNRHVTLLFVILNGCPACSRTALELGPFADDAGRGGTVASAGGGDVATGSGGSAQSNGGGAACSGPLTWTCAPAVVSGQCCRHEERSVLLTLRASAVKLKAKGFGSFSPLVDVSRRQPTGFGQRVGSG